MARITPNVQSFIASSGGGLADDLKKVEHITLPIHKRGPWSIYKASKLITALAKERNITHIHAHSRGPAWAGYFAAKALDLPFITTFHGTYNSSSFLKKFYNSIMVKGCRVVAISHFIESHIAKEYPWAVDFVSPIVEGIDTKIYHPKAAKPDDIGKFRKKLNLTQGQKLIVCVGRITRWKGQDVLLRAMQHVDNPQQYKILFIGCRKDNPDYYQELLKQTKRIKADVIFWENYFPLSLAYASADCVVSPSTDPEAFGRVIAETMAMGVPFIGARHGGAIELTLNGKFGKLVEPGNALELADAINSLPLDIKLTEMFTYIDTNYNLRHMAKEMAKLYETLV
jgi:glycosyltransferase involved in cell wall biosynthesis